MSVKLLPKVTVYDNINCFLDMIGSNIEITFKNGNKCVGPRDGDEFCKDVIYEYTWSNGDKYVGTIYSSFMPQHLLASRVFTFIPDGYSITSVRKLACISSIILDCAK